MRNGGSSACLIKDIFQIVLRKRRALNVLDCSELPSELLPVLRCDWTLPILSQLIYHSGIFPQINLRANDHAGNIGAVVAEFGEPLFLHPLKRRWGADGEADEEDVGLRVGEGTKAVVVVLTCQSSNERDIRG